MSDFSYSFKFFEVFLKGDSFFEGLNAMKSSLLLITRGIFYLAMIYSCDGLGWFGNEALDCWDCDEVRDFLSNFSAWFMILESCYLSLARSVLIYWSLNELAFEL